VPVLSWRDQPQFPGTATPQSRCCGTCAGHSRPSGSPGLTPATPASWSPGEDKAQARARLQIVKRTEQHKFVALPRRWVVERTFSWITRSRRTVRDYERLPAHHETMVYWAMTIIMTQRLA
jgi:hypothetical protein